MKLFEKKSFISAAYLNTPVETLQVPTRKVAEAYPRGPLNTKQLAILRRIYKLDFLIYEVSNQILDAKIEAFGRARMEREVAKLKAYLETCENCDALKFPPAGRVSDYTDDEQPKIKRDYFLEKMSQNRGYCDRGLQRILRDADLAAKCLKRTRFEPFVNSFDWSN